MTLCDVWLTEVWFTVQNGWRNIQDDETRLFYKSTPDKTFYLTIYRRRNIKSNENYTK